MHSGTSLLHYCVFTELCKRKIPHICWSSKSCTPGLFFYLLHNFLAGDDDNNDGDDKDDDKGNSLHQKADDDAEDFDEGCLIWSRKRNFPLRASLNVRNQMSSLRGRHQSMEKTSPTQNGSSRSHSIQKRQWPKVANHLSCMLLTVDSLDAYLHQNMLLFYL